MCRIDFNDVIFLIDYITKHNFRLTSTMAHFAFTTVINLATKETQPTC